MNTISSTDASLTMARTSLDTIVQNDTIETSAMKMSLDTMRDTGQKLVEMLGTLGQNINTYA